MAYQIYDNWKLPADYYTPEALSRGADPAELRQEYQRVYRVVQKRLRRFEEAGRTDAQAYQLNIELSIPSTQLSDEQLGRALMDARKMLTAKRGSLQGVRETDRRIVKSFQEKGVKGINMTNVQLFGEYMDEMRAQGLDAIYGSERCVQLFEAVEKKDMDWQQIADNYMYWLENAADLKKLPKHKSPVMRNADFYRAEIEAAKLGPKQLKKLRADAKKATAPKKKPSKKKTSKKSAGKKGKKKTSKKKV